MHGSKRDLPVSLDQEGTKIQEAEWGDMHVSFESYDQRFDVTPLLKGLPDDLDPSPHWGYVFKGVYRVRYQDGREEVYREGDAYYSAPGHTTIVEAGTEIIEFSPKDLIKNTMQVIGRNLETAKAPR
ncbi:MAG: cupin domain-containing protein [Chloroflexi bacterium]|nr:cupin domain-containing protein [Chloroflexota bacterium]